MEKIKCFGFDMDYTLAGKLNIHWRDSFPFAKAEIKKTIWSTMKKLHLIKTSSVSSFIFSLV